MGRVRRALVIGLVIVLALAGLAAAKKKHGGNPPRGPYPSLGACPIFPASSAAPGAPSAEDESAWNQDISQAPVDPNSAAYIAYIQSKGSGSLHPDFGSPAQYGFPYAVVGAKTKRTKVKFTAYGADSDHGAYRIPLNSLVEGGSSSDGDRHVLAVDSARCQLYELYRAFVRKRGKPHWNADSGSIWNLGSGALRPDGLTSADAGGLPIFPGLVRYDEAAAGQINHAIRLTVESTQKAWVHPGSHCAGDTTNPSAPPMGLRLRLAADYDTSALSGPALAIAQALKRYGLIVADNGSNWFISGTSDRRWPDENLNQLKQIPGSAFQVVQSAAPIHQC
jgi:hypothetical protein